MDFAFSLKFHFELFIVCFINTHYKLTVNLKQIRSGILNSPLSNDNHIGQHKIIERHRINEVMPTRRGTLIVT